VERQVKKPGVQIGLILTGLLANAESLKVYSPSLSSSVYNYYQLVMVRTGSS
jgi:hypothetical protein